jgi:hypothetical protein
MQSNLSGGANEGTQVNSFSRSISCISQIPGVKKLPTSNPLSQLWSRVWQSENHDLFNQHKVERDGSSSFPNISSTYWTLDVRDWALEFDPRCSVSSVLVRNEYREALRAAVDYYRVGKDHFPTDVDDEDEIVMEVDINNSVRPFANPFKDLPTNLVSQRDAFILLGPPGIGDLFCLLCTIESTYSLIGRTIWLYLVLVLRLEAGLPTIFQSQPNRLFVFDDKGVHKLKYSSSTDAFEFKAGFAPSTWCLIDSNLRLNTVPGLILDLVLFIVQASSPRLDRIEWTKKESQPVLKYFLKPWTVSELILGCVLKCTLIIAIHDFICSRTLQKIVQSEKDLLFFIVQYGPSACLAYAHSSSPDDYDKTLKQKLAVISYKEVVNMVNQAIALNFTNDMSHQIILCQPDVTRDTHTVSIASPYLQSLLQEKRDVETSARDFQVFGGFSKRESTR